MKRLLTAILSVCMLSASVFPAGGAIFSRAEQSGADFLSAAEDKNKADPLLPSVPQKEYLSLSAREDNKEDALLLPASYEQYLPLSAPSDAAVTEAYTAIADGNLIYVYNRGENEYRCYEHTANVDAEKNNVAKLQFAENGVLYFLDASTYLYTLDPATLTERKTSLVCSTFTIFSDVIYFTNVSSSKSQISKTTLDNLDSSAAESVVGGITSKPAITQDNGVLYYTEGGKILCKANDSSFARRLTESETVVSLAVYSNRLYYTDTAKNLYVRDLNEGTLLDTFEGGYSALTVSDGYVYAVKNDAVRQYSPLDKAFTDYEICASSDAENRLSSAAATLLTGDLLLTADNGNDRISVYDTKTNAYRSIETELNATMLASDGAAVLTADSASAILYDLASGKKLHTFENFASDLAGIAASYGKYYFITDNNYFYCAQHDEETGWKVKSVQNPYSYPTRLLAGDIYGNLYVAYADGNVYSFTENEFIGSQPDMSKKEKVCTVPVQAEKIAVDYEQTVYALYKNELYKYAHEQVSYSLGKTLVYGQTESTAVLSFAFGVEEQAVYLLYEGDFAVRTYDVDLPTVKSIAVNGADEAIFSEESASFSVLQTKENALMVNFDIAELKGAEVFPYLSFVRETQSRTALKLGETDKYHLIAVFDEVSKSYSTALILKEYCEREYSEEEYLKPPAGFTDGTGYLTNEVFLYKYPYLTRLLTVQKLDKNAAVTVLGEIDTLDYRYYYVSYTDENGAVKTGYVPKGYVTNFNGAPPEAEAVEYGAADTDFDSLWRMCFLLLGCACICVLADYLILHKRKS